MKFYLFLYVFFFSSIVFGQKANLDSLLVEFTPDYIEESIEEVDLQLDNILQQYEKRNAEQDSIIGGILHNVAAEYFYLGQYLEAIKTIQQSIKIKENIYPSYHFEVVRGKQNLAIFYKRLGWYDEALDRNFLVQDIYKKYYKGKKQLNLARTYREIAQIYDIKSDYKLAVQNYDLAIPLYAKSEENEELIDAKIERTIALSLLNQAQEVDASLEEILESLDEDTDYYKSIIYTHLADFWAKKDKIKAIKFYQKSINSFSKRDEYDIINKIGAIQNMAVTKIEMGDNNGAEEDLDWAFKLSKKLYENSAYNFEYASLYENYAEIYLAQDKFQKAIQHFQLAIINSTINFRDTSIYSNPDFEDHIIVGAKTDLLTYLLSKARGFLTWYDVTDNKRYLRESLKIYQIVDELIDDIRFSHQEDGSKLFWRKQVHPIYEKAIETAFLLGEKEIAFHFCEKSKAILLLDVLRDSEAKNNANLPDTISTYIKQQQAIIYEKELLLVYEDNIELREEILNSKRRLNNYIKTLEKKYPDYYQYKYDTKIITPTEVQDKLDNKQILIEYFISDRSLYSFVILKNDFQVKKINLDSTFVKNIRGMRKGISNIDYLLRQPEASFNIYTQNAAALYHKVIPEMVKNKLQTEYQLTIVPDSWLNYIPFEALLTALPNQNNRAYHNLPYLLNKAQINYAYSASLLYQFVHSSRAKFSYMGIAPSYDNIEERKIYKKGKLAHAARVKLGKLKANKEEILNTNSIFNGTSWIAETATENNFKVKAHQYRILHLAMHALVDIEEPKQSKLIFTTSKDNLEDDYLHVYELLNLKLDADLVVLSACSTGDGQLVKGEGVMSLARAFSYTGCPSTIMSLWNAEDQSTSKLIQNFFRKIKEGKAKNVALHEAKKEFLEHSTLLTAHPNFWANFVLIGNPSSIKIKPTWYCSKLLVLGFIMLAILLIYTRLKRGGWKLKNPV